MERAGSLFRRRGAGDATNRHRGRTPQEPCRVGRRRRRQDSGRSRSVFLRRECRSVATFIGEWNDGGPDGLGFQRALFRTDGVIAAALGDVIDGNQITATFDSSSINDFRDVAWGGHFDTALGSWLDNFLGVFRLTQAEQAMPPGALVPYLRALVDSLSLSSGIRATLDAKLDDIYASYLANRPNAVTDLNGVINYVEAQTGKGITQADADRIILGARAILLRVK
jgi:hypothetical protein